MIMKINWLKYLLIPVVFFCQHAISQTVEYTGLASGWTNYNHSLNPEMWAGVRYIPQINLRLEHDSKNLFDVEFSATLRGTLATLPFDTLFSEGIISPYRIWLRYSTNQFEIRAGLQKINFGSASMIRPLMWFDKLDPRDPLQLTNGVWGILARYYFLNNANIWLWALYGNKEAKTWEIGPTSPKMPELGGRFQHPIFAGELGLTCHYRLCDLSDFPLINSDYHVSSEKRVGLDGKWDVGTGLWFEGVWINKNMNIGEYTNQLSLCLGVDYTFSLGNGVNLVYEQLLFGYNKKALRLDSPYLFSTISASYPLGMSDNINAIVYFDWKNRNFYNMLTWNHQFKSIVLYCMGYANPKNYSLPLSTGEVNLFSGTGLQIMLVLNH